MCTSWLTQRAAASLEEATKANSTRSTRGSRRAVRSLRSTLSMPSRCHMPSSTCAPPSGRDASKVSSELAVTRNAAAGPAAGTGRRSAVGSRPGRPGRSGRSCRGSWCATPAPPRPTGCGPAAGTTPACRSCSAAAPPARTCPRHYQYHHRLDNMCCPIRVLGVHSAWRQPQSSDLRPYPGTCPRPALNCGTQVARMHLEHIDHLAGMIGRLDTQIEEMVAPFCEQVRALCTIPGIGERTAQVLIGEIGVDMSRFPSADHLASWAGLCPANNESAGKHRSGKTRKGNREVREALVEAGRSEE